MKKNSLVCAIGFFIALGAGVPANATPWDGLWLSVDMSVTLPKNKGLVYGGTNAENTLTLATKKYNTGNCFMHITDGVPDEYVAKTFCDVGGEVEEWQLVNEMFLYHAGAANVIGQDNPILFVPAAGQTVVPEAMVAMKFEGTFILNAKIVKDVIKSVTFSPASGMFVVDNKTDHTFGTTRSGSLRLKTPKVTDITDPLKACQAAADKTGPAVDNCGPGMDI